MIAIVQAFRVVFGHRRAVLCLSVNGKQLEGEAAEVRVTRRRPCAGAACLTPQAAGPRAAAVPCRGTAVKGVHAAPRRPPLNVPSATVRRVSQVEWMNK